MGHLLQIPKSVIALRGGWVVVWGTFFPGTKGPFGGFLLPETDPLGPAGARVLTKSHHCRAAVFFSSLAPPQSANPCPLLYIHKSQPPNFNAGQFLRFARYPSTCVCVVSCVGHAPHFSQASQLRGSMRTISNLENARDDFSLAANKKRCISTA